MSFFVEFCNYSTIGLCLIFKIPQILRVIKAKNATGVSTVSVMAELLAYTINLTYNISQEYPLSTYFEYYFCVLQDILLILILFHYTGDLDFLKFGTLGLFGTAFYGLSVGIPNTYIILVLIQFSGVIGASGKIMQLKTIWSTKNSENVSVLSWTISAYTCLTRIITTMALTGDLSLLGNFIVAFVLNLMIIFSAIHHQKPKEPYKLVQ